MSLPYTKQVSYLESAGNQWIDTGVVPTSTTRIELQYQYSTGNYTSGCGVCANGSSKRFHINTYSDKLHFGCGGSSNWVNTIQQSTSIHSASLSGNGSVLIDGNIYSTRGTVGDFTGYNIYLFRVNGESSYTNGYRVYYCKIYDNDVLVRDYIPVRVGQEGYLYDKVSEELFGNAGTGSFIVGNDIVFHSGFLPFRRRLLYAKPKELPNYLCFTALDDGEFTFTYGSDVAGDSTSVSYSLDGNNWFTLSNISGQEVSITTPTIQAGGNVYWKGINTRMAVGDGANKYSWFSSTGRFNVSGDLQSILYDEDFEGKTNTQWGTAYCFCSLFLNCTKLVNSKDLLCNAKFGNGRFYKRMFMGCSSLISTPIFVDEFNKGVGGNFSGETFMELYKDCTSLVNPNWQFPLYNPTNGGGIYQGMFENTGVLEARFQDSSKPLCSNIFNAMYRNCKNLTSVNNLPWTSLRGGCYAYLFQGCMSLQQAPALPATVLAESSYAYMFNGCTSLQQVPDIRITSLDGNSLESMFNGCTSLVHCPIKSLPAQVNYKSHRSLFDGCTSLVDVCDFPAETNAAICYSWMLRNTKVTYIKMLLTSISGNNIISNWVQGVPANGIFVKHIDATWTDVGASGVPSGWTVIYYDPTDNKYYTDQTKATECDDHGNPI